jgi:hypothetical protein
MMLLFTIKRYRFTFSPLKRQTTHVIFPSLVSSLQRQHGGPITLATLLLSLSSHSHAAAIGAPGQALATHAKVVMGILSLHFGFQNGGVATPGSKEDISYVVGGVCGACCMFSRPHEHQGEEGQRSCSGAAPLALVRDVKMQSLQAHFAHTPTK